MAAVDTTGYPAFTSKQLMMEEIERLVRHTTIDYFALLRRIANTDTSAFADPTYAPTEINPS